MGKKKTQTTGHQVATNRKARFNYEIVDTLEAGIVLTGSEVKSLRTGQANIVDAYAFEKEGEMWLSNLYIPEYKKAAIQHEPRRIRKLLLNRREINKLMGKVKGKGLTLIPLSIYFNSRGIAKVQLALATGKAKYDKRETEKKRDWERQKGRMLREK